jgi:hypothetical protein
VGGQMYSSLMGSVVENVFSGRDVESPGSLHGLNVFLESRAAKG